MIAGGDGTIHEVVNELVSAKLPSPPDLDLIIWPAGTANALYAALYPTVAFSPDHHDLLPPGTDDQTAYKMKSILAFLHHRRNPGANTIPRDLALARTQLFDSQNEPTEGLISIVVASASLHALILHTAERLRAEIPGLDRFKEAARRNITSWSDSNVRIFGLDGKTMDGIQIYDPSSDALVPLKASSGEVDDEEHPLVLEGPFAYFLSTVNVDRLEPTFTITSLFTTHPPPKDEVTMEIVVIRPARDPAMSQYTKEYPTEARVQFAQTITQKALYSAYDKGAHVKLRYEEENGGEPIVEYYRAGGWEWTPRSDDESSRLICADGTVKEIPVGGKARCTLIRHQLDPVVGDVPAFHVWV
ncbi:hypothetical protein FRC03_012135 [Tulasnella sp. 419]|nr:hypothetical protein FRC03_012135 [Tulasnella sp. 419]